MVPCPPFFMNSKEEKSSPEYKKKFLSIKKILSFIPNIFKNKNANTFLKKNEQILEIKRELLNYTHKKLTTEVLAKYVLNKQT